VNCPRVQENNQDIKGQKDEGIEIVVEVKLNPGLADGFHAALEDGIFDGVGITGDNFEKSEDNRSNYHYKGEKDNDYKKQSD
jgi:hypothetical protein